MVREERGERERERERERETREERERETEKNKVKKAGRARRIQERLVTHVLEVIEVVAEVLAEPALRRKVGGLGESGGAGRLEMR